METEKGIFLPGTNGEENGFDATSTNKRPVGKTRANNRSHRNSFSQLIHIYIGPGLHGDFKAANRSVEPQQTEMNRLCGCNVVLQFGLGSLYHEFLMAICTAFQIPLLTYTVWLRCVCVCVGGGGIDMGRQNCTSQGRKENGLGSIPVRLAFGTDRNRVITNRKNRNRLVLLFISVRWRISDRTWT